MSNVIVLGMAVVDFVFAVEALPTSAQKYCADDAQMLGGGPAANAAVAIARLGGHPNLAARMGDDTLADLILQDLKAEGVGTDMVHRSPGGRSSFSSVYVDSRGERQIMNFRGAGLSQDTGWLSDTPSADAVLVDTRWTQGALQALKLAKSWGVTGVVDGEAPIDRAVLNEASHVAFSRPGLQSLTQETDLALGLKQVAADLPGWACVTDGENGVWYTGATGIEHIPAFKVKAKDTLAAGDIWHGAFALALAEGQREGAAIRFANAAAALKCMTFGGRAGCPNRAQTEKFLKETTQ